MKKNRIIAGVLSAVIVTGTVVGIMLSQPKDDLIEPNPTSTVETTQTPKPTETPSTTPTPTIEPTQKPTEKPTETPNVTTTPQATPTPTPSNEPVMPTQKPEVTSTPTPQEPTVTPKPVDPPETTEPNPTEPPVEQTPKPSPSAEPTQKPSDNNSYDGLIENPVKDADFLWNRYIENGCSWCGSHGTCGAFDHSTHTFNSSKCETYDEYEATHCDVCGKEKGNGTNGTCLTPMTDSECYYCGESIKAGECHTCK